ncbi:hypothetical protein ASG90_00830 [Nocardioides sp. Soil797]|nr:hypothetical protein ASG90_00830 [Nocardioides sp. Soil797]
MTTGDRSVRWSRRPRNEAGQTRPLLVAVTLLSLALSACGGDGDGSSKADQAKEEPSTTAAVGDRVAPKDLPRVPALGQAAGAVSDVKVGDCSVAAGEQQVTGSVTGSGKKARDYVVVISWINKHSDVRGRAVVVEKSVAPGESRDWRATATVAAGATECVPNVQAGSLREG